MKVGDEFFHVWVEADEGAHGVDLWVITSIRSGKVYACRKADHTWVKQSSKTGDYGWAKNLSLYDRKTFPEGKTPAGWAKTKAAALTQALPDLDAAIKRLTKLRARIVGQRTKQRRKSAKPKEATDGAGS